MNYNKKRPVFLDILKIDMPAMAILSIGHRISGVLLFLSIPFFLYLFDLSLSNQDGFNQVKSILSHGVVKYAVVMLFWGFIHHFFAGIRFLLIDIQIGMDKNSASKGAWFVHICEIIALLIVVWFIL
ncbi:MAG: succinate dehydrogenase, cytochrome b556 subunit [Gammaproteobacteria bacterium]|nr:succinate dehydrogenase, cytochrome b556 subunit [Gammaproteobacteria bacterium]